MNRDDLNNNIFRAARELRDKTRNLVKQDDEALAAWRALDEAINTKDDIVINSVSS